MGFFSDDDDDENEAGAANGGVDDEESEEIPASIQSWAYQMSSSSSSESEYEYDFLPGMQNTMAHYRAISNARILESNLNVRAVGGDNNVFMIDGNLPNNESELSFYEYDIPSRKSGELEDASQQCCAFVDSKQIQHTWREGSLPYPNYTMEDVPGSFIYENLPSSLATHLPPVLERQPTASARFLKDPDCFPFGKPRSFVHRKLPSALVPPKEISQQHQQHPQHVQHVQQAPIAQNTLRTYRHQQVERGLCNQYQPSTSLQAIHPEKWVSVDSSETAVRGSTSHPLCSRYDGLGPLFSNVLGLPSGPTNLMVGVSCKQSRAFTDGEVAPSPPLGRRGGRPVPPCEMDLRWNIWTVGNLEIRCKASGVGVKHLRQVLHRDDNYIGYRRSKWTHERLLTEVMARRAKQEARNEVVGRPQGFLAHQGWWFYIEAS